MVLKTQFLYQLPWGMTSSFNFQSQSGKPIYSEIRVPASVTRIPGTTRIVANVSDGEDRTELWQTLDFAHREVVRLGGDDAGGRVWRLPEPVQQRCQRERARSALGNANYLVPSRFIAAAPADDWREGPF